MGCWLPLPMLQENSLEDFEDFENSDDFEDFEEGKPNDVPKKDFLIEVEPGQ